MNPMQLISMLLGGNMNPMSLMSMMGGFNNDPRMKMAQQIFNGGNPQEAAKNIIQGMTSPQQQQVKQIANQLGIKL